MLESWELLVLESWELLVLVEEVEMGGDGGELVRRKA